MPNEPTGGRTNPPNGVDFKFVTWRLALDDLAPGLQPAEQCISVDSHCVDPVGGFAGFDCPAEDPNPFFGRAGPGGGARDRSVRLSHAVESSGRFGSFWSGVRTFSHRLAYSERYFSIPTHGETRFVRRLARQPGDAVAGSA